MPTAPGAELDNRLARFQARIRKDGLDAAVIVQNADLFYFTGTIQSGALHVPAEGAPVYMVRKDAGRARAESALENIVPFSSFKDIPGILSSFGLPVPERLGMELDVVPVNLYERYRKIFPAARIVDVTPAIRSVRAIKSPHELERIREAAAQLDRIWRHAMDVVREGMTDIELAAEVERFARLDGHQGIVRMRGFNGEMMYAHVFSGPDTAAPAYLDTPLGGMGPHPSFGQGAGWRRIGRNEPVIVDAAGSRNGYLADQTRILSFGPLPEKLRRGYEDMRGIEAHMAAIARPGVAWGAVYESCLAMAREMGHEDHFMGVRGARVSFIGHGLGLEIDEYPFLARGFDDDVLETGMVFAFEPKVVYPGEGAVGIENTFLLTDSGVERITFSDEELVVL